MSKKFWACLAALAFAVLALIMGAWRANAVDSAVTLADNPNSPQSVKLIREITGVANPVNNYYTYNIVADAGNPAQVSDINSGQALTFTNALPDEENRVSAEMQIDFSTISFRKVGTYRFVVTEGASQYPEHFPIDRTRGYVVEVVVSNRLDGDGNPTGEIYAEMSGLAKFGGGKSDILFSNAAGNSYVEISKRVQGAAGDTDAYFMVDVFIGGTGSEEYTIRGLDEHVMYKNRSVDNPTTVTANTTISIYIKHGQTATIGVREDGLLELPIGSYFSATESITPDEGYTTTINGGPNRPDNKMVAAAPSAGGDLSAFNTNNKIDILNKKDGSGVDTGVAIAIAPFIVLLAIGGAGYVALKRSSLSKNKK